jgi:sugar O-acyltransferase (sialic acid O-acetyltransferase NeuD family)
MSDFAALPRAGAAAASPAWRLHQSLPPLLVYGSRSFARTVSDLAHDAGFSVAGMIDDDASGPGIVGTLRGARDRFPPTRFAMAIGIGYQDLAARWRAIARAVECGWTLPVLVHPRAYVAASARLEPGCLVMAGAIVDRDVQLGTATVVWPGACINHDVTVGRNCFVSPNATVCGHVRIGDDVFVGAAAVIADHCDVPSSSFIKMGARYAQRRR